MKIRTCQLLKYFRQSNYCAGPFRWEHSVGGAKARLPWSAQPCFWVTGPSVSARGENAHFPAYRQWLRLATVPTPSNYWVAMDEHPDSVIDGYFLNNPGSTPNAWGDSPDSYHNGAGGLSFADGHSEIHKWRQPQPVRYTYNPDSFNAGGRQYYAWWIERTAVLKSQ